MKKRGLLFVILFLGIFLISLNSVSATPQINLINMTPSLDFTRFLPYNITVNITNNSALTSVQVNISGINGEGVSCWDYYTNGTCGSETLNFDMTYDSLDMWKKQNIYPDYIYPEIFFASSEITWNNQPSDISMWRRNYHLFNFTNSFSMIENMSFWVEVNALATNTQNSNDLFVYIVGNGSSGIELDYFTNDWRTKDNTELVATFSRNDAFHHTHTTNSSHRLVALATNPDGTIGTKNINASDNFWIVLYQDSPNINKGWDLRYQNSSLCNNQNSWYIADRAGGTWRTPVAQAGCPDAHIHIARNNVNYMDGVNATIIATDENSITNISSQDFYYGELANLAPNPTAFTNPVVGGLYNETFINITWNPATDPNPGDILTYNLSLLNADESFNQTLNVTTTTSYYWNITDISDGNYNLRLEVCDDATPSLCTNSTLGGNFTLDKITPVYTLTSRSIISNNSFNSSLANAGDLIIVYFNSSGPLTNPNVTFYSGGYSINNSVTIANTSNSYNATYIVNESDIDGGVDFEIIADNLDIKYIDAEDSDVVVDKTAPSLTIMSPTATTYTSATQLLNISATDSHLSTIWYNWNGTNTTYSSATNIVFSEGSNTISIWANDSLGNLNSSNVSFTINTPSSTHPSRGGGGSSYYFYEKSRYSKNDVLELKVKMRKNTQKDLNIDNSKETSISKISLTSRDYLSGEIKFSKLNSLPLNCNFPNNLQNNIIYRIIQINSTIEKENLESVSLSMNIDNLWINQNKIIKINGIKCLPSFENVESSLIQEEKDFSSYKFTSDGFSTWIIFGTKESKIEEINDSIKENLNETSENPQENKSQIDIDEQEIKEDPLFCFTFLNICWYWWLIPLLLFVIMVFFAIYYNKKRKKKKHKKK